MALARAAAARLRTTASSVLLPASARLHATAAAAAAEAEPWPVVVVGAGPTGLTAALLLAKYGVPSLVLERSAALTTHPQAHFINHRTMEVLRAIDPALPAAVTAEMPPLAQWRRFVYCASMMGEVMGEVDHFQGQTSPALPAISPEPVAHLSQHRLLPLLAASAAAAPGLELRMGHAVQRVDQDAEGVTLRIEGPGSGASPSASDGASSPSSSSYSVRAQYVVAADGARGGLRSQLGVPLGGPGAMQHLVNIHFVSRELGVALSGLGREGMLYFVFNPDVIAVIVAHNIDAGEFVAQVPYFPPLQTPADFGPEVCAGLVRAAAGAALPGLELREVRAWTMAARIADRYQEGRVVLAGDAAHVVPPSGAFGMNTGVQDAHNLAWKLAAAVRGPAGAPLVATYGPERRPVGAANMALSVSNFHEALRVPSMMGLDFRAANLLSDTLASSALAWVPPGLRRTALESAISMGRAAGTSLLRPLRGAELSRVFTSGETLRLQYPKEDLGFAYASGALRHEAGDKEAVESYLRPKPRDAPYVPAALVGARMPHCGVDLVRAAPAAPGQAPAPPPTSTLDVVAAHGSSLTLLLSGGPAAAAWRAAAGVVEAATGVGVRAAVVLDTGEEEGAGGSWEGLTVVRSAEGGAWGRLRGVGASGAVLVRPDGHVAWRWAELAEGDAPDGHLLLAVRTVMRLGCL